MVVKARYVCSMQVDTNFYWNQNPQQHVITVPIRTILHPRLEVNAITDIHDIPQIVCKITQAKIYIKTSYMSNWFWLWLYIKINWSSRKNNFERDVKVHIDDEENWYEHLKLILYVFLIYLYINYHQIFYLGVSIWCVRGFICMHRINVIQLFMFTFILVI